MPIPADNHAPGDTGHVTDHNNIADELTTIAAAAAGETTRAEAAEAGLMSRLTQASVLTASGTAAANQIVPVNTTSGNVTVTLPSAPAAGTLVAVKQIVQGGTNTVTIACAGSDVLDKAAGSTTSTLALASQGKLLQYNAGIWINLADDLPLTQLQALFAPLASPALTGTPTAPTATALTASTVLATTAYTDAAFAAGKPLAAENTYYVSAASSASDSNDGLSVRSAKATIAGALTALGSSAGNIILGAGTFTISAADGSGNGVTLPNAYVTLTGAGWLTTTITINCAVTWGVLCTGAGCKVSNLTVTFGSSGSATYGAGVDTPTATGSTELCVFQDVFVGNGTGTVTNGFAVGPTHTGVNTPDIAETYFIHCRSIFAATAAFCVGNGTVSQILNTYMFGCYGGHTTYGIYANATNVNWSSGTLQKNTYDIYFDGALSAAASRIAGFRSENSKYLLGCNSAGNGSGQVTLEDISWQSPGGMYTGYPAVAGNYINWSYPGTLNLVNITVTAGLSSGSYNFAPVISLTTPATTHKGLAVNVQGFQAATTLGNLFSSTNTQATATISGFVQLDPSDLIPLAGVAPPATESLEYSATTATINSTTYQPMVAPTAAGVYSQTLASPAANITFSSIPQTYSQLHLLVVGASASAAESDRWSVQVNGSSSSIYDIIQTQGTGTPATNTATRNAYSAWVSGESASPGELPGAQATTGTAGLLDLVIPNYAGTTLQKTGFYRSGYSDPAAVSTVAAGSTGGEISTIATWGATYGGNGVLAVANGAVFSATGGTLNVAASGSTTAVVTFTGVSGNTLTGCAYVSGSATGTVATGGAVTSTGLSQTTGVVAWRSTAAITSIKVYTGSGSNLIVGTAAYLYAS